ncbi:V8-like Glu-specific endopeptidase [Bradyrhizobium sp. WSM1253]|nr:V8-like Glu-specific endopeptidase [Bradyrhizobium sp. WSM1253]
MIASQTLAAIAGTAVLLPVVLTELPSVFSSRSSIGPNAAPRSVTEINHRQIVDARLSPYSAIGKLRGALTCTAAIVLNPRIIVTAAHCVTERDGTTKHSSVFQLSYQSGADLGRFQAIVWAIGSKQDFTHETVREVSGDWAILVLDRAPAEVRPLLLSHFSLKELASLKPQIQLPAYSNDVVNAEVISVDPSCSVRELSSGTLVHTCVARPGSSGAPLLLPDGSDFAIIGIHTASIFASDRNGHVGRFVGNEAVDSSAFSEAVLRLSGQLDGLSVQAVNAGDY